MSDPVCVADYERLAEEKLDPGVWGYFAGGAMDEWTLRENVAAFSRWRLRPRFLVDVSEVRSEVELLGSTLSMPLVVAPVAYQGLLDPDGECATARAAAAVGTAMCVSTVTTRSHAEIAAAAPGLVQWAQLYVLRDEGVTKAHLDEAVEAGCRAVLLTIDTPVFGRRERDLRTGFVVPSELPLPYMRAVIGDEAAGPQSQFDAISSSLTWRDIEWIADHAELPVLVKGLLTREDAILAVEAGAAGIVVSNHGGRQLDGVAATLDALPEVVEAVEGRLPVLLDGGIRRGTDVLKALALGATAVLAGRAPIFGLAVAGEAGALRVLELLRDEIRLGLGLLGCTSPEAVGRAHVERAYDSAA